MTDLRRVLIVHNRYRTASPGGEDRVVDQEAALLAQAGLTVTTFQRHNDEIDAKPLFAKAAVPMRVPWSARTRAELRSQIHAQRPDIVHIHNTFPLITPSAIAACTDAGVPAVATLHNYRQICSSGTLFRDGRICTDCAGGSLIPAVRHGCYRNSRLATVPLALTVAAHRSRWWTGIKQFFCISEAQRTMLIQGGMPSGRLAVKHNFVADPGLTRSGSGQHVLYLGRLAEEKGVRLLMTAWDRLTREETGNRPLVIAGHGPLEPQVRRWAQDRADVVYLGMQSREECRELTLRAATVVVPSTWLESFGLAAVEAMAAGVPVVAARHGALPELVHDEATGFLHRPGDSASLADAVRRVLADSDRNIALGQAARVDYESRFTPKIGLAALIAGYEAAMAL